MIQLNFTLFIQLANFLILLVILNAILYKPILAKIREREALIKGNRDKAAGLEQQVSDQQKRHQEELAKARQIAADEKKTLMADAKKKEVDALSAARAEATKIVEDMKAAIRDQAEEARKTLKAEMAPLAQSITEKLLGRSI
ncbi:MAG: ATP synthase F0 subunit B [Thermodesulfobacteriota bacterium]